MMKRLLIGSLLALASLTTATRAQEVVIDGLYNPCGITVQPETGTLFVADSGNRRIVRIVDGAAQDVIVEFGKDVYGKGPMYDIGPLGIAFLDQETLVVGGGGAPDGEEALFVYKIPAAGEPAINAADAAASFTLAATDEIKGEGNFYGLAVTEDAIYVTCNGDDTKGWVSKADRNGTEVGPFTRFLATKEATEVDAPVAITVSPEGHLAVGQMGEISVPGDGLLTFYRPEDGNMLANFALGLSDICGLAYSPKGQLFAVDFSWHDTTQGGLFQLIRDADDATKSTTREIAELDKPTAMVFGRRWQLVCHGDRDGRRRFDRSAGKVICFSGL
ncbi:MAG: hypothetical protein R3B96_23785 [Pirellulaceae bacterium]